jgi:hypothetical protein
MKCRQCGAEIAEKALICYRCGTATTEPAFKPPSRPRRSPALSLVVSILAIGLLVLVAVYTSRTPSAQTPRFFGEVTVGAAVFLVAVRAILRRRR